MKENIKCHDCGEDTCMCASIRRGLRDIKEGKTFLFSCKHDKKDATICFSCHADEVKRWYRMGKRDALKRQAKSGNTIK